MPPSKWDDEEEGGASPPPPVSLPRRGKFDDEEEEEVLDSWDAEDDSDVEREKEAKAKAEAEAKSKAEAVQKKSKAERIEEHRLNRQAQALEREAEEDSEEDEAERRARLRATEKESDLAHAADLFGENGGLDEAPKPKVEKKAGGPAVLDIGDVDMQRMKNRSVAPKSVVVNDPNNPTNAIDLSAMSLFKPTTKDQFSQITQTLTPLLTPHTKKPHYSLWAQEFTRQLVKDLPSGEIKKIASVLTTASNEKMREERAADKGSKKSKAAKTKVSLAGNTSKVDTTVYDDDGLDDGDFM